MLQPHYADRRRVREPIIDLALLALLVLFFGIQQRNRPETHFRTWLWGWLCILGSVALWEWGLAQPGVFVITQCLRLDLLVAGGLFFVFSFVSMRREEAKILPYGVVIAVFASLAIDMVILEYSRPVWLLVPVVLGHLVAGAAIRNLLPGRERTLRQWLSLFCAAFASAMVWATFAGRPDYVLTFILCEIFLCAGLLFSTLQGKDQVGRALGTAGFAAWTLGYALANSWKFQSGMPMVHALWNVPKHFVGFGMILILFGTSREEATDLSRRYKSLYEEFRLLYEHNPHPMWIYQPGTGRFLSVNDAAVKHYGYTRQEFLEMTILQIRPPEDLHLLVAAMAKPDDLQTMNWRHQRKDGSIFDVDVTGHDILFKGEPARFILAIDISEREMLHRQLQYRAQHDVLTDLANRSVLEERLPLVLEQAAREGCKAAILTMDADRFKQINDTFGHLTGDECLKEIATRLRSRFRQNDVIARTGGEEFTALIGGLSHAEDAEKISNAILDLFQEPLRTSEHEIRVSLSIGVAIYPEDGATPQTLRKRSDQALYYAKRNGGDQTVFASEEIYAPIEQTRTIEFCLRRALRNRDFHLVYHPVLDRERNLSYFEALLRTSDPGLAAVGPAEFIPVAEECGLIGLIGRWALEETCRQLQEWSKSDLKIRPVAVNVSAKQLASKDFVTEVTRTLESHEIPRGLLMMELTETTVMTNQGSVKEIMSALSELGVAFAIDDFGTGYSSLARLNDLPLASLKIDRSFVDRIDTPGARTIIEAVIQIARNLDLKIVAEGVETLEQYNLLRASDCDLFQGYYFSRPLPAQQAAGYLTPQTDLVVHASSADPSLESGL